jgi:hypothetical protein
MIFFTNAIIRILASILPGGILNARYWRLLIVLANFTVIAKLSGASKSAYYTENGICINDDVLCMSGGKFQAPNDRVCNFLFGLMFACIGLFAVLIVFIDVLLGLREVSGDEFWSTLLVIALLMVFAVIGISEMIRSFTIRSDRISLRNAVAADGAALGAVVTGVGFFYTWAYRIVLFEIDAAILAGGLYVLLSISLPSINWSEANPTIWPAIFVVLLILPTIVLVLLNLRRR